MPVTTRPDSGALPRDYFSPAHRLDAQDSQRVRNRLAQAGVRLLPYPFASAMAVLSDVDASCRRRYEGYVGAIVDELGLDFGDSTWLTWQHYTRRTAQFLADPRNKKFISNGFGFLTPWLTTGRTEPAELYENTRTFFESALEYHKGNVDHFHAFFPKGVRVAPITEFGIDGSGRLRIEPKRLQFDGDWHCYDFFVQAVCVVGAPNRALEVEAITGKDRDGKCFAFAKAAFEGPKDGRRRHLFEIAGAADAELKPLMLDVMESLAIEFADPAQAVGVDRVLIVNAHGAGILERLEWLRDRYNVEVSTITEHSSHHFRGKLLSQKMDAALKAHVESYEGPLETYNGTLTDDQGEVIFSSDADLEHSFGGVFPAISRDLEVRFVGPTATMSNTGWDPLDVVTPSSTRAGGGVYFARRTRRNAVDPPDGAMFDGIPPRWETFTRRLTLTLEDMTRAPGMFWPVYTHLGSWTPGTVFESHGNVDAIGIPVPTPYFDAEPMRELQDRVFNISGSVPPASRVWFSRGSTHYDYALMLRSIGDHLARADANTVSISSWTDPALEKVMPRSPAQLYGLTFYVEDLAAGLILLDGQPIETLFLNPPDETGRPSLTIAECDIRHILFSELDPAADPQRQTSLTNAAWSWEGSHGRLTLGAAQADIAAEVADAAEEATGRPGSMTIRLRHWLAPGAQAATFRLRGDGSARFGILFETETGGRFFFGEGPAAEFGVTDVAATYAFDPRTRKRGAWRRLTVPFHALAWAPGSQTGGPMPNHPIRSVALFIAGELGESLEVSDVSCLRPRATSRRPSGGQAFCLGGRVQNLRSGDAVRTRLRGSGAQAHEVVTDQRGYFCFEAMGPGVYEVWRPSTERSSPEAPRLLVDLSADTVGLVVA